MTQTEPGEVGYDWASGTWRAEGADPDARMGGRPTQILYFQPQVHRTENKQHLSTTNCALGTGQSVSLRHLILTVAREEITALTSILQWFQQFSAQGQTAAVLWGRRLNEGPRPFTAQAFCLTASRIVLGTCQGPPSTLPVSLPTHSCHLLQPTAPPPTAIHQCCVTEPLKNLA